MKIFRKIIDFYIDSSIHVALSCFCLVKISQLHFNISKDFVMAYFAFFGTVVGYNFVKYEEVFRVQKVGIRDKLKFIFILSVLSLMSVGFYFFQLQRIVQLYAIVFLILTLLYTLPFFPNRKNARNWAGVKIYIVSLCWVGVTIVLPILNADIVVSSDFYLQCLQRFILIFVLILIFEIIDLAKDDPHLQTVPQQIGVKKTKILGFCLLIIFCSLELFNTTIRHNSRLLPFLLSFAIAIALAFANEKRSKYYTSFWVESIPILWWLLLLLL
jgi:hypothetical protein